MDSNHSISNSLVAILIGFILGGAIATAIFYHPHAAPSVGDTTSANQVVVSGNQIALYPLVNNVSSFLINPIGSDNNARLAVSSATSTFLTLINAGTGLFGLAIGTTTEASTSAIEGWGYSRVQLNATSTACEADTAGEVFYNSSNAHEWGCNGTSWTKIF